MARHWPGGVSDARQEESDLVKWLTLIRYGEENIRMDCQYPVLLKKKEVGVLFLQGVSFIEPRAVRRGGYGGPSFRVTKGMSFRLGAFQAESQEELREIDRGSIVLTTKRLLFAGAKRNVNIDLKKIVDIEYYQDGTALRRSGIERVQYFKGIDSVTVTFSVEGRTYRERLTGLILKYMIEGLVNQL